MQSSVPIFEYALILENQCKQALLEEEEKKRKKEKPEEAKRVDQRIRKHLHEQLLAEQAQLEMAQIAEQETDRQLISEASEKLSEAGQGKANNLQGAKVEQAMLSVGNKKLADYIA